MIFFEGLLGLESNKTSRTKSERRESMRFFQKLFLLACLLGAGDKAYSCAEVFIDNRGTQVIVNYVQKYYVQNGRNLPAGWFEKIDYYTYHWKEDLAIEFLNFLEERIGQENTVKKFIQSPSFFGFFKSIRSFKTFKARVDFYEEYIGEEVVNRILNKSLTGFIVGNTIKISDKIKFIEKPSDPLIK